MATATYFKNTPNSSSAASFTWAVACAVGSTIFISAQHQAGGAVVFTDSAGNTWSKVGATLDYSTPATSQRIMDVYMCVPTTAVSSVTVTGTASFWVLQAFVVNAVVAVESSVVYAGGQPTTGALTVSAGSLELAFIAYNASTAGTEGAAMASPWANVGINNFSTTQSDAWRIASAASSGSQSAVVSTAAGVSQYGVVAMSVAPPVVNTAPTIAAGATIVMSTGGTATVTFTADDTGGGTIASFDTPTVVSSAPTPPTVAAPTLTNIGTNHATASYVVSGLTNSDTTISTRALDNVGAPSATVGQRIVYTSTSPRAKAVTLTSCTMTSPSTGTPLAAWNAWLANPYDATTNPTGVAPPEFTTAAPPASNASVVVDYQPLDIASVAPSFSQSWALTPDTTVPATVYVDLRFSGVTKATASATLSSLTPVPVGRTCTSAENTAIGASQLSRVAPSVVGRFA